MIRSRRTLFICLLFGLLASALPWLPAAEKRFALRSAAPAGQSDAEKLIAAVLGPSPMEENLRQLTDEVGGRVPGTAANQKGVAWGVTAFRRAGVDEVHTEKFSMPVSWSEGDTRLDILAPQTFRARAVSIAWAPPTPQSGIEAPVIDLGDGTAAEFERAGAAARGALLLVHSRVLHSWADLFAEYENAPPAITRALEAGAAGILWMSSREQGLLYRHTNITAGELDRLPQALVAREDALRVARFLAAGHAVRARFTAPNRVGGPIEAENVVAEIRGSDKASEIVMIGAHLDSWELGSGALDNGCNSALVIEVARAFRAAGIRPRRTLRFGLWNGEEQGLLGSWAYARAHRAEFDKYVAYINFDEGTGRVTGYSVGGRKDMLPAVREILKPVESWGMNEHTLKPETGTDHLDFLLEGVPTLLAEQEEANYLVNYHASSDTMDKVDLLQLKLHAAYAAVTMTGIAQREERIAKRQSRAEIEAMIKELGFDKELQGIGVWPPWLKGERGRQP